MSSNHDIYITALVCASILLGTLIFVVGLAASPQTTLNVSAGLTASIHVINWGNLTRGESKQQYFMLTNVGEVPLVLSFSVGACEPAVLLEYVDFTFDLEQHTLLPNQTVEASITLHIFREANFKFKAELTIIGTGD